MFFLPLRLMAFSAEMSLGRRFSPYIEICWPMEWRVVPSQSGWWCRCVSYGGEMWGWVRVAPSRAWLRSVAELRVATTLFFPNFPVFRATSPVFLYTGCPRKKNESTAAPFIGGFQPSIHQIKWLSIGYKTAQQIHAQPQGLQGQTAKILFFKWENIPFFTNCNRDSYYEKNNASQV
jgi:hypothetical protein